MAAIINDRKKYENYTQSKLLFCVSIVLMLMIVILCSSSAFDKRLLKILLTYLLFDCM